MPDNGITVEQIQIKINQESTNALKGIESLATALQGLKTVTTGGIKGLTTIANQLNKLNNAISAIPDLSRLEQLNNVLTKLKDVGEINIRQTVSTLGSGKTVSQLEQLNEEAEKVMHGVGERVEEALDETKDAFSGTGGTEAFSEVNDTVDVTVDKIENLNALIALQKEKIIELQDSLDNLMSDDDADDSKILNLETQIERAKKSLLSLENELTKALTSANVYSEGGITDAVTERFTGLSERFATLKQELDAGVEKLNTALGEKTAYSDTTAFTNASTFADNLSLKIENLNYQMAELQSQFTQMKAAETPPSEGEWASFENRVRSVVMQMRSLKGQCDKTTDAVNKIGEAAEDAEKKGTSFASNFAASLKRIALYRIVRALLKQAANAISDGIENYAQYSEEANETISELKSVWQQFSNSLGVTVTQLLTGVLPILQSICNVLIDVVNAVNYFIALISGKSSYSKAIKQNLDYADSLESVQNSLLGIDEINKLSDNDSTDYSSMFEEVDLTAGDTIANILEIVAAISTVLTLLYALKGVNVFSALTTGAKALFSTLKNMSALTKFITSVALLGAEAYVVYENVYAAATGTESWGTALLAIIPICAAVGVAMYAMWGPVGVVIAAVVAAISGVVAGIKAVSKAAKDKAMTNFWNTQGTAIEEVTALLNDYIDALGIDKLAEWNDEIEEATDNFVDLASTYNYTLRILQQKIEMNVAGTEDIEELAEAFNDLAEAAKTVNEAQINSLLETVNVAINTNIDDALLDRLTNLGVRLETALDLLNTTIDGINSDYQSLLSEVAESVANGESISSEQWAELEELRSELDKYTLTDQTSAYEWSISLSEALEKGVSLGFDDVDSLTDLLDDLKEDMDDYLSELKTSYASGLSTLNQLIELGLTDENGNALFSQDDIDAYTESYKAMIAEIEGQYDSVIQGIYDSLSANAMSNPESTLKNWTAWLYDWSYYGEVDAYEEQQEILAMILEYLGYTSSSTITGNGCRGCADGGILDSGEIFVARENGIPEMVGSWGSNHSAVANNEQIVEGIKQGVYEAMVEAGSAGGDGGNITVQFVSSGQVKSEQIITAAERRNRRDGKKVIAVEV